MASYHPVESRVLCSTPGRRGIKRDCEREIIHGKHLVKNQGLLRQDGEDTVEVGTVGQDIMDLTHPEEIQSLVCHGGEGSGEADTSEQAMRDQVQPEVNTGLVCQLGVQGREETGHAGTSDQRESSQTPRTEVNFLADFRISVTNLRTTVAIVT